MASQITIFGIAIGYFILMVAIGVWASRRTSSAKEFLAAGQSLGFFVMAIATFASVQSGWGMVGGTGSTYEWGIAGYVAVSLFTPFGFALAWFLLGSRLRRAAQRHEIYSLPDFIKVRYGSRAATISMSVALALGAVAYMTAQIGAMGILMRLLFGVPFGMGVWIGAIIIASYTIAGGMLAAVWTDLIQGVLMVVMSLVVFVFAISNHGGWFNMLNILSSEDPALVSAVGAVPITWVIGSVIMVVFGCAGQPQIVHKFLMLRDESELRWGAAVAGVAYALTAFFVVGVALSVRASVIQGSIPAFDNIDRVAPYFLENMINPVVGGLALTALLAAIMSSASSFITIGASAIMRDLAWGLGIRVEREVLWGRISSGFIVLASVIIGVYLDQIVYLAGAFGWATFAAAIFGPIVFGLYWKRATAIATTTTVIVAVLTNFTLTILTARGIITLPEYFFVGGFTVAFCILFFIVVSYLTQHPVAEERFSALYPEIESLEEQDEQASISRGGVTT